MYTGLKGREVLLKHLTNTSRPTSSCSNQRNDPVESDVAMIGALEPKFFHGQAQVDLGAVIDLHQRIFTLNHLQQLEAVH